MFGFVPTYMETIEIDHYFSVQKLPYTRIDATM